MAIGTPPVLEVSGGSTGASHAYGSFTPPANSRLYAWNTGRGSSAVIPTISDDLGGTWNLIAGTDIDAGAVVASLYYQDIGGSPAAMVITIASTSATQTGGGVVSVTGGQNDHTNLVSDTDTVGDPSLTMGTFAANSTCLGFYANTAGGAVISPSGYTELLDAAVATNLRVSICFDSASPGTAMAWTGTGTDTIGIGLEIKETSANKILAADAGSFAFTGQTASLELGREVVADAGSFAFTGQDASLEFGREIAAEAGAFALTGQTASLEHGYLLTAEAGAFVFTGQTAALTYSGFGKILIADAGSFTFSGQDAALEFGREIVAGSGTFGFTGSDATLTYAPAVQPSQGGAWLSEEQTEGHEKQKKRKRRAIDELEETIERAYTALHHKAPKPVEIAETPRAVVKQAREIARALVARKAQATATQEQLTILKQIKKLADQVLAEINQQAQAEEEMIVLLLVA